MEKKKVSTTVPTKKTQNVLAPKMPVEVPKKDITVTYGNTFNMTFEVDEKHFSLICPSGISMLDIKNIYHMFGDAITKLVEKELLEKGSKVEKDLGVEEMSEKDFNSDIEHGKVVKNIGE